MPSLNGDLQQEGGRILAIFGMGKLCCSFQGTFKGTGSTPAGSLACPAALTYGTIDQLTGSTSYKGTIGPSYVDISFGDYAKLQGTLKNEIDSQIQVSGEGSWNQF